MSIDLSPFADSWSFLLKAVALTIFISAMSMLLGFVVGVIVGALRTYGGRTIDFILGFYVDTMRSIPLLVILIWIYFAFPMVIGASVDVTSAAIVGLGLHLGAYMAETIRAGLTSVQAAGRCRPHWRSA